MNILKLVANRLNCNKNNLKISTVVQTKAGYEYYIDNSKTFQHFYVCADDKEITYFVTFKY